MVSLDTSGSLKILASVVSLSTGCSISFQSRNNTLPDKLNTSCQTAVHLAYHTTVWTGNNTLPDKLNSSCQTAVHLAYHTTVWTVHCCSPSTSHQLANVVAAHHLRKEEFYISIYSRIKSYRKCDSGLKIKPKLIKNQNVYIINDHSTEWQVLQCALTMSLTCY